MFVIILTYRARPGEEDAIIALHENWQGHRQPKLQGFFSGELLRSATDVHLFTTIARFRNQAAAQMAVNYPDYDWWYQRLVSLTEGELTQVGWTVEWQTGVA